MGRGTALHALVDASVAAAVVDGELAAAEVVAIASSLTNGAGPFQADELRRHARDALVLAFSFAFLTPAMLSLSTRGCGSSLGASRLLRSLARLWGRSVLHSALGVRERQRHENDR